jgi:hypothetical protein
MDGDGFTEETGDCDDGNDAIHPDAPEILGDLIDNDCDGIIDPNTLPVAIPGGPYQVALADGSVTLNGSESFDPDEEFGDQIVSYHWDVGGLPGDGPVLTLELPALQELGPGQHEVVLTVEDSFGERANAGTSLEIFEDEQQENTPPVADPGGPYEEIVGGGFVTLDGSRSFDPDQPEDFITRYCWDVGDGLFDHCSPDPEFVVDIGELPAGDYLVQLTVEDTFGEQATESTGLSLLDEGGGDCSDNDNFNNACELFGFDVRSNGNNEGFGTERDEPNHGPDSGPHASAWWLWEAPEDGRGIIDTCGSDFDTVLAVYTGDDINDLSQVASNDDGCEGGSGSEVQFDAFQGTTYYIAVDGKTVDDVGNIELFVELEDDDGGPTLIHAIAWTDVGGDHQFTQDDSETFIALLVDVDQNGPDGTPDGVPGPGDVIVLNSFPTSFDGSTPRSECAGECAPVLVDFVVASGLDSITVQGEDGIQYHFGVSEFEIFSATEDSETRGQVQDALGPGLPDRIQIDGISFTPQVGLERNDANGTNDDFVDIAFNLLFGEGGGEVDPIEIGPGQDLFATHADTTEIDLSQFDESFVDLPPVQLQGVPLGPETGNADTIVARLEGAELPDIGSVATVPIELVALQLQSVDPIDVGGESFVLDVFVGEEVPQQRGEMTVVREHEFGGYYTAELPVEARLVFTSVDDPNNTFDELVPFTFFIEEGLWDSEDPPEGYPDAVESGGFFPAPGIVDAIAEGAQHCFFPAQIEIPPAEEGRIVGYKFHDLSGDGIDNGEPRLEGVEITLSRGETGEPIIVDNRDEAFSALGFTGPFTGQGFQNDVHFSAADADNTASWTFAGLDEGIYRVSVTWSTHPNRATDAPFSINGGEPILVNQELAPNNPAAAPLGTFVTDSGTDFADLSFEASPEDGTITVALTDAADGFVLADAVRIQRVPSVVATTTTDDDGQFSFFEVADGTYTVAETVPAGYMPSTRTEVFVSVVEGDQSDPVAFGNFIKGSIHGFKFEDLDRDGRYDVEDEGVIYTVQRRDGLLRTIDPSSGDTLTEQEITFDDEQDFFRARGLALDPTTGTLYALLDGDGEVEEVSGLFTIDPETAEATFVGEVDILGRKFGEIEFDGEGNLHGITGGFRTSVDSNSLFSINKDDPTDQILLHQFDPSSAGGLAHVSDLGECRYYRFSGNRESGESFFESIDLSEAEPNVSRIPLSGNFPVTAQSMTYLGNGEFLLYSGQPEFAELYLINTSGESEFIGNLDHTNIAHGMAFVPSGDGESEPPMADIPFELTGTDGMGNPVGPIVMRTNEHGEFWKMGLVPGHYWLREMVELLPSGLTHSTQTDFHVTITSGEEYVWRRGAAMLDEGDPRHEVNVGAELMFGNYFDTEPEIEVYKSAGAATIIDNGDAGFSAPGYVGPFSGQGFQNDVHFAPAGSANVASWEFTGLTAGVYRVSTTWSPHPNRATNSPFSVIDSDGSTTLGLIQLDQELAPDDFSDSGAVWEELGTFVISGTSLTTILSNDADEFVIADAVRVEKLESLTDGVSTVDFGATVEGSPVSETLFAANVGTGNLTLTEPISVPPGFSASFFGSTLLAPGSLTPFTLRLDATVTGPNSGTVSFGNNDTDENPFDINVTGRVEGADPEIEVSFLGGGNGLVIDNGVGAPGFSQTNGWAQFGGQGFSGDVQFAFGGGRHDTAAFWTFTGLAPGTYHVATTWSPHPNRATDAPYSVFDGTATGGSLLTTSKLNQQLPPGSFNDMGAAWEGLGTFTISGDTLAIRLTNDVQVFHSAVIADAVRIEALGNVGEGVSFGTTSIGDAVIREVVVSNTGTSNLTLDEPISVPEGFSVHQSFGTTTVAPGASTSFQLQFSPPSSGLFDGIVSFGNNDADDNPFTFTVTGLGSSVLIVDNGDPEFSAPGYVGPFSGQGFQNDVHFSGADSGNTATWTFTGLPDGDYRVSATWTPHPNRASNAPFAINGGTPVLVNQDLDPNNPLAVPLGTFANDSGANFADLSVMANPVAGAITVTLADGADGFVIADAVRIELLDDLRADVVAAASETSGPVLTADLVDRLFPQAVAHWSLTDPNAAARLANVEVRVADLSGNVLGLASEVTSTIWLDSNAAGHGWQVSQESSVQSRGAVDLQHVLTHELGHVLGHDDLDPLTNSHDIMAGNLATGGRQVSAGELNVITPAADRLFADFGSDMAREEGSFDFEDLPSRFDTRLTEARADSIIHDAREVSDVGLIEEQDDEALLDELFSEDDNLSWTAL